MKAFRITLLALALAIPAHQARAQGKAPSTAKMTPEERNAAQARLNQQAALLAPQSLDAAKAQLRRAVITMRDSLDAAATTAALITRAQATKSTAVELSQSRHLRDQCAAGQRTSALTLTHIASLNTSNLKGVKLLNDYRASVTEAGRLMGECQKSLAVALAGPTPVSAKIAAVVVQVNSANSRHNASLYDLMTAMEIPIRP
jgi:hypothetical protein